MFWYKKTLFKIVLLPFLSLLTLSEAERYGKTPLANRQVHFADYLEATALEATALKTIHRTKIVDCALMCLKHPKCLSFNYCAPETCQLSPVDIYSDNAVTSDTDDCRYYGMKKHDAPQCWEKGMSKPIENDQFPGPCVINEKRHDSSWGVFVEYVDIDTEEEWKKMNWRECFLARHAGIEHCVENETVTIEWLKFIHSEMSHNEAIYACSNMGGNLFFNINGTAEQLLFFRQRLFSPALYWLGIWFVGSPAKWQSITGLVIPPSVFLWADGEPNNGSPEENRLCVAYNAYGKKKFMHDCTNDSLLMKAVCDML